MRLQSIKLVGFKSFVDPTTVNFPSNMCAVVGPNGCGKSNIIDAVRWVMGESSAKHLRGESMTDVIFNGSGGRKPVGQASIELVFDNTERKLGGQYSEFNEISIKRRVTRDGQSDYFLNGAKCRRRDITDIFLGTGLGPRSYAIIEQGMISRLIEAKPEELRVYLEEAAGISKYKERRRDTENRMRRTRDNLDRLTDIRDELERQLNRLKRQSRAAARYKEFKQEERTYKLQNQALQWQRYDALYQEKKKEIDQSALKVEEHVTQQVAINTKMETLIEQRTEKNDAVTEVQTKYYSFGSEIARLEQIIQNQKERVRQLETDEQQITQSIASLTQHLTSDQLQMTTWTDDLSQHTQSLEMLEAGQEASAIELQDAEEAMQSLQSKWDEFSVVSGEGQRKADVEKSKIQHLEHALTLVKQRIDTAQQEQQEIEANPVEQEVTGLLSQVESLEARLQGFEEQSLGMKANMDQLRERNHTTQLSLNEKRSELEKMQGRFASLEALQQVALGQKNNSISTWLNNHKLDQQPRLAEHLKVESGYDVAVETVLGDYLQAVCVDNVDAVEQWVSGFDQGKVMLVDAHQGERVSSDLGTQLSQFVSGQDTAKALLSHVYVVDDLSQGLALRKRLGVHESVVTKDGIWMGSAWLRINKQTDEQSGVLARQQEMKTLQDAMESAQDVLASLESEFAQNRQALSDIEVSYQQLQSSQAVDSRQHAELRSNLSAQQVKIEQMQARKTRLAEDTQQLTQQYEEQQAQIKEARGLLEQLIEDMQQHTEQRESLQTLRDENRQRLDAARQKASQDKDAMMKVAMQIQSLESNIQNVNQNAERMTLQLEQYQMRSQALIEQRAQSSNSDSDYELELEIQLEKRLEVEQLLQTARTELNQVEHTIRELEQERQQVDQATQRLRAELETQRLGAQEDQLRCAALTEQIETSGQTRDAVIETLPEDASEAKWVQEIERLSGAISRLGPINLAAIDEFEVESERKIYLDKQFEDLNSALDTLASAIRKIDKETKDKFKETYESVNAGLQELFPKVFGGGSASLDLTAEEDLLNTGVLIKARPPGKRNSTIHLLSGGEKALTALALVFSIFRLNPAPFCMLDEVDAPLDDANTGRYARLVNEMSKQVQFIYITHNKITMEYADQLLGVTMHEPGVSRLVSVDVQEAVELAAI